MALVLSEPSVHAAVRLCASAGGEPSDALASLRRLLQLDKRAITLRDAEGRTALCLALELDAGGATQALLDTGAASAVWGAGSGCAGALTCALPHAIGGRAKAIPSSRTATAAVDASLAEHISHLGLAERNRSCCAGAALAPTAAAASSSSPTPNSSSAAAHIFSPGAARVCASCGACTADADCEYLDGSESPGDPCGCGQSDAGCVACGLCRTCCASLPRCSAAAGGAGGAAAGRTFAVGDLVTLVAGSAGSAQLAAYCVPGDPGVLATLTGTSATVRWLKTGQTLGANTPWLAPFLPTLLSEPGPLERLRPGHFVTLKPRGAPSSGSLGAPGDGVVGIVISDSGERDESSPFGVLVLGKPAAGAVPAPSGAAPAAGTPPSVSQYRRRHLVPRAPLPIAKPSVPGSNIGRGCDASCTLAHSAGSPCLVCGIDWGLHAGHFCPSTGARGSWGGSGGATVTSTAAAAPAPASSAAISQLPLDPRPGARVCSAAPPGCLPSSGTRTEAQALSLWAQWWDWRRAATRGGGRCAGTQAVPSFRTGGCLTWVCSTC